ncbi:MAG: transglutaminase-like domain-containing protein [Zestosphaera sp.]
MTLITRRITTLIQRLMDFSFVPGNYDVKVATGLAERLKDSDKYKALINVMEWIDKNITYWHERAYLDLISRPFLMTGTFIVAIIIFLVLFVFLLAVFSALLKLPLILSFIVSLAINLSLCVYFLLKMSPVKKFLLVILGSTVFYMFTMEMLKLQPLELLTGILHLSFIYWATAGGSLIVMLYLIAIYLPLTRHYESKLAAIIRLINLTFTAELSVEDMLKLRRGVCKDYARLIASVLVNLFPKNRIYFFIIPGHVATGIEINGKIYVLDQKLPILTINAWLNLWNTDCTTRILVLEKENHSFSVKNVERRVCRDQKVRINLNKELEELVEKVHKALTNQELLVQHILEQYAKVFDIEDKAVYESIIRKIKITLEKELVNQASPIRNINLSKEGDNIMVDIQLTHQKPN